MSFPARIRFRDRVAAFLVASWRVVPWPGGRGRYFFKDLLASHLGSRLRPMKTQAGWLGLELAGDVLQERLFFSGRHDEEGVERWLTDQGTNLRGATVFDVGGHVGYWATQLAAAVGPGGRVLAFEPQPELAMAIRLAARWNFFHHLEVHEVAVAEAPGELTLRRPADRGRTSLVRVEGEVEAFRVPALRLDDFCRDKDLWPDWIKIDIEGAEWLALQGMPELLTARRCHLLIEIHPRQIVALGGSQRALVVMLEKAGYRLARLGASGPEPLPASGGLPEVSAWHLLATP